MKERLGKPIYSEASFRTIVVSEWENFGYLRFLFAGTAATLAFRYLDTAATHRLRYVYNYLMRRFARRVLSPRSKKQLKMIMDISEWLYVAFIHHPLVATSCVTKTCILQHQIDSICHYCTLGDLSNSATHTFNRCFADFPTTDELGRPQSSHISAAYSIRGFDPSKLCFHAIVVTSIPALDTAGYEAAD